MESLLHALAHVARIFGCPPPELANAPLPAASPPAVRIALPPSGEAFFIPGEHFPDVPPVVLIRWIAGETLEILPMRWSNDGSDAERLVGALREHIEPSGKYNALWGEDPRRPMTHDPEVAARAGWRRVLTGRSAPPPLRQTVASRIGSSLSEALGETRVLLFGLGSVGSYVAEQLVRTGLGAISLVDFDDVEAHNLSRTPYDLRDVGLPKASALTRRLLSISPGLGIESHPLPMQRLGGALLRDLFARASVVIAATDDPTAQAIANACAFHADRPALYIGLYAGAKGGEVSLSVPGLTPCFKCQTGARRALPADTRPERDYGTGRLQGEVALGCDIHHVASAAVHMCCALVAALRGVAGPLEQFFKGAIVGQKHLMTMGMVPDFWFYDQVLADVPGQYAFQSIWLTSESAADCSVCGPDKRADDPFESVATPINAGSLRNKLRKKAEDGEH
jgi:molybdopterin/thiamine biosynthesis adenylyltransferase